MILEYHRPNDIDEALLLLSRSAPPTIALGGGNLVSRKTAKDFAVVDLQNLGLNILQESGTVIDIGATTTLEDLYRHPAIPEAIKNAVHLDATLNTRNTATIGGAVVAGTGASALFVVLQAMDARLEWLPGNVKQTIGDFGSLKDKLHPGKLLAGIQITSQAQARLAWVGRSPLDPPFLIVAIARWPSGRTRLVLGGKTRLPILAMDGSTEAGIVEAGLNACSHLSNQWISDAYLKNTTAKLIQRLIQA